MGHAERRVAKGAGRGHGGVDGLEVGIVGLADTLGSRNDKVARVAAEAVVHGGDIVAVAAASVGRSIEAGPRAGGVGIKVVCKRRTDGGGLEEKKEEDGEDWDGDGRREPSPTLSPDVHCVCVCDVVGNVTRRREREELESRDDTLRVVVFLYVES